MSTLRLAYNNQADTGVLAAVGTWNTAYPLSNLQDYRLGKKARTSSAADGQAVVRIDLGTNFYLQCAGLMAHNLDTSATYRVRVFTDNTYTTASYDSGTVSLYPSGTLPESDIPAGSSNSGTAKPTLAQLKRFQRNLYHFLSTPLQARYIQIEVFNSTNADGYLQFGRLFLGSVITPTYNPAYGALTIKPETRTDTVEAEDGTPFFYARNVRMSIQFALTGWSESEEMTWLDMIVMSDIISEVLLVTDAVNAAYQFRKQLFGRLRQLDPIDVPQYAQYKLLAEVTAVVQA